MTSDSFKDSSKLATAAEELIKAACSHVETASISIDKETVEGLKKLSESSSSIEKQMESMQISMDFKVEFCQAIHFKFKGRGCQIE